MGQVSQYFQPPLLWQQFEDLTLGVFKEVFGDPSPSKNGRQGQPQHGVDVYGSDARTDAKIGIQCKQSNQHNANNKVIPDSEITDKQIHVEYKKALGFIPKLDLWILATTAKRDAKIQEKVRHLDDDSRKSGHFGIKLWCWDDYVTHLNNYDDLQKQYYSKYLCFLNSRDQDRVILELYAMAFSRPAFQVPLRLEGPDEFLAAIRDTKRAMNTGELRDRNTGQIIRRVLGGRRYIDSVLWRKECNKVYTILEKLYQEFMDGKASGKIRISRFSLQIDQKLENDIEVLRKDCLAILNRLFISAGLATI